MAYSVAAALSLLLLLRAAGVRLPPLVSSWDMIPDQELLELHEASALPTNMSTFWVIRCFSSLQI